MSLTLNKFRYLFTPMSGTPPLLWYNPRGSDVLEGVGDPAEAGDAVTGFLDSSGNGNDAASVLQGTFRTSPNRIEFAPVSSECGIVTSLDMSSYSDVSVTFMVDTSDRTFISVSHTGPGNQFAGCADDYDFASGANNGLSPDLYINGALMEDSNVRAAWWGLMAIGKPVVVTITGLDFTSAGTVWENEELTFIRTGYGGWGLDGDLYDYMVHTSNIGGTQYLTDLVEYLLTQNQVDRTPVVGTHSATVDSSNYIDFDASWFSGSGDAYMPWMTSAWVKLSGTPAFTYLREFNGTPQRVVVSSQIEIRSQIDSATANFAGDYFLNSWNHYVWSYDGSRNVSGIRMWQNGVEVSQTGNSGSIGTRLSGTGAPARIAIGGAGATLQMHDHRFYRHSCDGNEMAAKIMNNEQYLGTELSQIFVTSDPEEDQFGFFTLTATGTVATSTDIPITSTSFTVTDTADSVTDASSYTFSNVNIGDPNLTDQVIVSIAVRGDVDTDTISSVTIGGVAATIHTQLGRDTTPSDRTGNAVAIASAIVNKSNTEDIVVNLNYTAKRCSIAVMSARGIPTNPLVQTFSIQGTNLAATPNLSIGGQGLAVVSQALLSGQDDLVCSPPQVADIVTETHLTHNVYAVSDNVTYSDTWSGSSASGQSESQVVCATFGDPEAFIMTVDTTQAGSASDTMIIPTHSGATYNCTVYWGDGNADTITTYNDAAWTHQYASGGTYTITITGTFGRIYFNNGGDKLKVTSIVNLGDPGWESLNAAFHGCSNNTSVSDSGSFQNASVTDLYAAWYNNSLTSWSVDLPSSVTTVRFAWALNSITSWTTTLPSSVTNLAQAWENNSLTSWTVDLPSSVTNLDTTWKGNAITSWTVDLPSSVTTLRNAWNSNSLTSWSTTIPSSVTDLYGAWYDNSLTSWSVDLPSSVTIVQFAWALNSITSWTGGGWAGVTNAASCLSNANINTTDYNALWVEIETNNSNSGVSFDGGSSVATGAGLTARNAMTTDHSWTITDGTP